MGRKKVPQAKGKGCHQIKVPSGVHGGAGWDAAGAAVLTPGTCANLMERGPEGGAPYPLRD